MFGDFQDALTEDSWTVYHSRLSFAMNVKMLSPREVIEAVERKWREAPDHASIAQVEGFIRQILGWREYMRGVYWAHMPEYAEKNFFQHDRPLPGWFWTGETGMRCLQHAITQTLDHAYAHHIQRLMVTGNFALLAGIDPDEVDGWYLGVYIDAIEWVEITNTRGMSQFADGGIVGTKPYVSSANYMHKMGPHCAGCRYNRQGKTEDDACPFNSLYWHFHARNRHLLEKNPRIGMVYRTWDKMDPAKQQALLDRGDAVLAQPRTTLTWRTLHWFRNDLRLDDNPALQEALRGGIWPAFVIDPAFWQEDRWGHRKTGPFRTRFLWESVADLQRAIEDVGGCLHGERCAPRRASCLDVRFGMQGLDGAGRAHPGRARHRVGGGARRRGVGRTLSLDGRPHVVPP